MSSDQADAIDVIEDFDALGGCLFDMSTASTLERIETAALAGLVRLTGARAAYFARWRDGIGTITNHIGLFGDVRGVTVTREDAPDIHLLFSNQPICWESPEEMSPSVARMLVPIGLSSLYGAPIVRAGELIGVLAIGNPAPSTFDARSRAIVRLFTMQYRALLETRDLVQSLEAMAESAPVIVLRTDPSGWINWYNGRWYEYTGQTLEEASGWGWQTAHHPEDFLRVMEEWPKALATGQPIEIEFRLRRHDDVYRWHLARVMPVRNDKGDILSWYGSVVDIEAQKSALARTKRIADTLQKALLPADLPQRERLQIDAVYVSAEGDNALVGGDWYDAFALPDGRIGFSIGDVGGHGLDASVTMAKLRQSILTLARFNDDPALVLEEVNQILRAHDPGVFVTAMAGFISEDGSNICYASAGQPPPMLATVRGEPAQVLPLGGVPLGVLETIKLETHAVSIPSDAVFAAYTDGVTEYARNPLEGEAELRAAVSEVVGDTSHEHAAEFVFTTALRGKSSHDDAALLLMQFSPRSAHRAKRTRLLDKEWRFHASDAKAASVARQEIGEFLRRACGDTEQTFQSELIIGELLANTVAHAPGLVHLVLRWTGEHYVLTVRDNGPGFRVLSKELPKDVLSEGNRGLFIISALSLGVHKVALPNGGVEMQAILPLRAHGDG